MTQFHETRYAGSCVPYEHAARAYRESQAGMPPFGGWKRSRGSGSRAATRSGQARDPSVERAYEDLWLRPGAPMSVVRAAYRSLAARSHPDVGGDPGHMLRLNTAYETLRRTLE